MDTTRIEQGMAMAARLKGVFFRSVHLLHGHKQPRKEEDTNGLLKDRWDGWTTD